MSRARKWAIGVLFVVMVVGAVLGADTFRVKAADGNDFSKLPVSVYAWWGGEFKSDESASLIGQYYGWELYFPNTTVLALDFKGEYSSYDVNDRFGSIGIRISYGQYSFGLGLAEQIYGAKPEIVYGKGYAWASVWYPSLDGRLAYDQTFCCDYGRVSASVDWRGRPFGASGSYMFDVTPSGTYEEFRINLSGYLGYSYPLRYETEHDYDLRLYIGPRWASFTSSAEHWQIEYTALTAGIRFRSPYLGIGLEYQFVYQEDPWHDKVFRQDKFVINANTSLGGLWLLLQEI
jgi:hypothetical protein